MSRCFLARLGGDTIKADPPAAGANLRKLLRVLRRAAGRFVPAPGEPAESLVPTLLR